MERWWTKGGSKELHKSFFLKETCCEGDQEKKPPKNDTKNRWKKNWKETDKQEHMKFFRQSFCFGKKRIVQKKEG